MRRAAGGICAVLVAALLAAGGATATAAPVGRGAPPPGFFGVVPQGPLSPRDLNRMQGVVGSIRVPVYWSACESEPGEYDFAALDQLVGAAAEYGIGVLPFVYGTPAWLAADPARPPLDSAAERIAWARFLKVLVRRYGPDGRFWRDRGVRVPIRRWQIWNEPNFVVFWHPRPSPRGYARLLGIAARAVRSKDPGARIVMAGVAPVSAGLWPWDFMRKMYAVPGVGRDFDLAAVHPYAASLEKMDYQVGRIRGVMARFGDAAKPLLVSELGVASDGDMPSAFVMGRVGQAAFLRSAFDLLLAQRRRWHIAGIDWFSWQDAKLPDSHCAFCQGSGLVDVAGDPKPALTAFRHLVLDSGRPGARSVR
jgi:polysaccharide biosynthesis protein PslG